MGSTAIERGSAVDAKGDNKSPSFLGSNTSGGTHRQGERQRERKSVLDLCRLERVSFKGRYSGVGFRSITYSGVSTCHVLEAPRVSRETEDW